MLNSTSYAESQHWCCAPCVGFFSDANSPGSSRPATQEADKAAGFRTPRLYSKRSRDVSALLWRRSGLLFAGDVRRQKVWLQVIAAVRDMAGSDRNTADAAHRFCDAPDARANLLPPLSDDGKTVSPQAGPPPSMEAAMIRRSPDH